MHNQNYNRQSFTKNESFKVFRKAIFDIDRVQQNLHEINEDEIKEMMQLESNYNKLREPLYANRALMIQHIPFFWNEAICNHPRISMILNRDDRICLHFLKSVDVDYSNAAAGFKIKMVFDKNPFFFNKILTKSFQAGLPGEIVSSSTVIKWKRDKHLTKKQVQNASVSRDLSQQNTGFFTWFSDNTSMDDIANIIKDDLYPDPFRYYTNEPPLFDSTDKTTMGKAVGSEDVVHDDEDQWETVDELTSDEDDSEKNMCTQVNKHKMFQDPSDLTGVCHQDSLVPGTSSQRMNDLSDAFTSMEVSKSFRLVHNTKTQNKLPSEHFSKQLSFPKKETRKM